MYFLSFQKKKQFTLNKVLLLQYIFEATSTVTLFLVGRHCCLLIIKNIRNKVNFFNYVVEFLTAFHSFLELLSIRVSYFFNKKLVSFLILLCEKIPSSRLCFLCTVSYVPSVTKKFTSKCATIQPNCAQKSATALFKKSFDPLNHFYCIFMH